MLRTVNELAEELRVAPQTIRQWRKRGLITGYMGERKLLFDIEEVRAAMRKNALDGITVSIGEDIQ